MKEKLFLISVMLIVVFAITACGTAAMPSYEKERILSEARAEATRIVAAAESQVNPAEPTRATSGALGQIMAAAGGNATPTEEAHEHAVETATEEAVVTEVVAEATEELVAETTEVVVAEGTEEAGHAHADHALAGPGISAEEDPMAVLIRFADPAAGEALFNKPLSTGLACSGCHLNNSEAMLVGPGLYNVINVAGNMVEGQGPYTYLFNSIRNSQAFVVPGFTPVMPVFAEFDLSDQDIYNLVAYISTLHD